MEGTVGDSTGGAELPHHFQKVRILIISTLIGMGGGGIQSYAVKCQEFTDRS